MRLNVLWALASLAVLPSVGARAPLLDGYVVTQRITSSDSNEPITMRIKVAQGRVRVELDSPQMAQMGGMHMLLRDDGRLTAVMAQAGMAIIMDASMLGSAQGMITGQGAAPEMSDFSATVDDLGAGERIVGYATHKYRVHTTYTMTSARGGATKYDATIEASMATDVPGLADGLQKVAAMFSTAFGASAGGKSKAVSDAVAAKMPKGYALKSVVKSVETSPSGQAKTTTATIEVTEVSKVTFEAAEFEVPAGMQVMDIGQMMRGRGGR